MFSGQREIKPEKDVIPKNTHPGVYCDSCKTTPIVGYRYKCKSCLNYDLCSTCMRRGAHSEHVMMKIELSDAKADMAQVRFYFQKLQQYMKIFLCWNDFLGHVKSSYSCPIGLNFG